MGRQTQTWANGLDSACCRKTLMTVQRGLMLVVIDRGHQAGGDDGGDQWSLTTGRLENGQKVAKSLLGMAMSLVAIIATGEGGG